jgi:MuDR family transposase
MPTISIPDTLKADFASIDAARIAIREFIVNIGESYRVTHADRTRHIVACRDTTCKFTIRASLLKGPKVRVTQYTPHSCSPFIHHRFQQANSVAFLKNRNRDAVADNRKITPAQIQSME